MNALVEQNGTPTPILVLGMHRGGTSAMAGLLHLLGFDLGPSLMQPAEGVNNKGFWEHLEAFRIHERLFAALGRSRFDPRDMPTGWREHPAFRLAVEEVRALVKRDFDGVRYWAIKDPRMCRIVPVWLEALSTLDIEPRVVLIVRHPAEVARSMQAQHWIASTARSHLCWLQHMLEAEQATRGVARSLVTYDALLADWRTQQERIGRDLALEWPPVSPNRIAEIDAFLDAGERRFDQMQSTPADRIAEVPGIAAELFDLCQASAADAEVWPRIAALGEIYRRGADALAPCLDEAIVEASLAHFEIGQGRLAASVAPAVPAGLLGAVTEALDSRLAPLHESIARSSTRFDAVDAALRELSARIARSGEAEASRTTDAQELRDRLNALAEAVAALQEGLAATAVSSGDFSRNYAEDARALRASLASVIAELRQLAAASDARFSLRGLFGGKHSA